ncbi:hypothetical protein BH23GEM5_BH23GEM5_05110 [soil metagenome]
MSTPSAMLRPVLWTSAAIYLVCTVVVVAATWLVSDILPGNGQAMARGVAIPVVLVWLSVATILGALAAGMRQQPARGLSSVRAAFELRWAPVGSRAHAARVGLLRN